MKLSKPQIKKHKECEDLLLKDNLSFDEKLFVYEHWFPAYGNQIGEIASFFTPVGLANDFTIEVCGYRIIDLCAGIGMLSFLHFHQTKSMEHKDVHVVCIERNPDFVRVGKILFPEATWICADVLDQSIYADLGKFDCSISNPPFGKIKSDTDSKWLLYKNAEFEYKVIEIGSRMADYGVYIVPRMSSPFQITSSGYKIDVQEKYRVFEKQTGLTLRPNCGIDCSYHESEWVGAAPKVEIVRYIKDEPYYYHDVKGEAKEQTKKTVAVKVSEYDCTSPVTTHSRWREIFGYDAKDVDPKTREARWKEWKRLAILEGETGKEIVDYWTQLNDKCATCKLRTGDWCNYSALPITVNPILTIREGIIGMACMGLGYQENVIQPTLF